MALNTGVNNFTDGSIVLKDATGTPITVTAQYSQGDFGATGLQSTQREVVAYQARGVLTSVRYTNRTFVSGSFTCQMTGLTNATAFTADAVMKAGAFSAGVSTLGASAEVWAVTIVWTVAAVNGGTASTLTLTDCVVTMDVAESDPNTLSFSYTCYGTRTLA